MGLAGTGGMVGVFTAGSRDSAGPDRAQEADARTKNEKATTPAVMIFRNMLVIIPGNMPGRGPPAVAACGCNLMKDVPRQRAQEPVHQADHAG